MIKVQDLYVVFNKGGPLENPALRGLSLTIPAGCFVTVIGSNGAGKSTLLNALAGEIIPDRGAIVIDDRDVTRQTAAQRANWVARVFQDPLAGVCADLTIEENLALAAARGRRRGLGRALNRERRERWREQLARLGLGLEQRLRDHASLLSGGQRQALSLVMAALQPMKILLLDEHTASLDPKTAAFILELTGAIIEQQRLTALMVTHSLRHALDVGERTVMLHQGRIVFDVAGETRSRLEVADLLRLFEAARGDQDGDDDWMLG